MQTKSVFAATAMAFLLGMGFAQIQKSLAVIPDDLSLETTSSPIALEPEPESEPIFQTDLPAQDFSNLTPIPLDRDHLLSSNFIDVRGVGDAAISHNYQQPPKIDNSLADGVPANFGKRLDRLDPDGQSYRGDLNFINWETVISNSCQLFRGAPSPRSFAFITRPENIAAAYERGFNLMGLANNHSGDCERTEGNIIGSQATAYYMSQLRQELNTEWLWHGVGNFSKQQAVVREFMIKGKPVKVAFANIYMGGICQQVACQVDSEQILNSFDAIAADLKILSMHSWNEETHQQLVALGEKFITKHQGDVVFGHGPHVWKPVTLLDQGNGKKGVMFESLGNFIHPQLLPQGQDFIGRALFDLETLQLAQVQGIPVNVQRAIATYNNAPNAQSIPSKGFKWQSIQDTSWGEGLQVNVTGVYHNLTVAP
ncbi:MAG: CapA family protein [Synechococcaceae cyanobacterium RL_1_2]|nr:CapA family protein [Synechococcaceae cyanobacterium RL_1_2]